MMKDATLGNLPVRQQVPMHPILNRLVKTSLGALHNQLRIGPLKLAFDEGVLIIENPAFTQLHSDLTPENFRVVIGDGRVLLDMWPRSAASVALAASPTEVAAAQAFFLRHGIPVKSE